VATLVLVRHGQAGTYEAVYDQLSPLGERQMAALGRYWGERGRPISRAFVGPLVRQRRSFAAFEAGLAERGGAVPARVDEAGLVEYDALTMMQLALPRIQASDPVVVAENEAAAAAPSERQRRRHMERLFQHVSRRWVKGELDVPEVAPFADFRRGVEGALERMVGDATNGDTTLVFTSGGVVAAALGHVLGLSDEKVLELSWIVRNAAFTEILYSSERMSLFGFNAIPHLDADPSLVTLR